MANIQPLDNKKHAHLKVKPDPTVSHSQNNHLVTISVYELVRVQQDYPVAFIKDSETGRFHLLALLGLQPKENLFYSEQGWKADYIPQQLLHYPFTISSSDAQDNHMVCVDFDSDKVSEKEGESLFKDGEPSEYLTHKNEQLGNSISQAGTTRAFIEKLAEAEILAPQSLNIKLANEQEFNLTGLYAVDETKLNELSDEKYSELRKLGYIGPIYACMFAMHNVANLVKMKANNHQA